MIFITSGTCGTSQGLKTSKDGLLSLPEAEEARLVRRGVAKYPDNLVAMPSVGEEAGEPIADMGKAENAAEGTEAQRLDPEQLKERTNAELRGLAEEMGIDCKKLRTKAQLIAAICDVPLEDCIEDHSEDGENAEGDGEQPPALEVGAPVV